ncbi:MAG: transporter substrate-binding domain-containing protein, partial [Crocinitomicaceae bacterium]|nr:transporter substrate-binding domain-containing protein [Crocinitomicaceae bacterium]
MGRKKLLKYYIYFILVALAGIVSCGRQGQKNGRTLSPPVKFDLDSIKHRGKIILLTENSASTYYLYRGQAKGFDYELVKSFAEHIGVQLEVHILDDVDEMFELLNKGEGDLIASNLTITHEREKFVRFSNPLYFSRQMLVQRKYDVKNPDSLFKLLTDTAALDQLPVWVHEYSSFYSQLKKMESRSGKKFAIEEAPGNISTDDLVRLTASGEVNATVTDE